MANHNNCLSRKSLAVLLHCMCRIPEWLHEGRAFGRDLVAGAVESCFSKYPGPFGVAEELFMEWMLQEPQTLVWWSTLYRMQVAEAVIHSGRCGLCKRAPMTGLRYRCLMCWRLDICQHCFFSGISLRQHSNRHPLQEYCREATGKERTRALLQTLKNRFLGNSSESVEQNRYLPIQPSAALNQELSFVLEATDVETPLPPSSNDSDMDLVTRTLKIDVDQAKLQSIIVHMEEGNRCLATELERLPGNTSPDYAQNVVLRNCNLQLDVQLQRLKMLLSEKQWNKCVFKESSLTVVLENYSTKVSYEDKENRNVLKPQMESTPSALPFRPLLVSYLSPITDQVEAQTSVEKCPEEESGVTDCSSNSTVSQPSITKVSFHDLSNYEQASSSFSDYQISNDEKAVTVDPELDNLLRQMENLVLTLKSEPQAKDLADQLEQLVEDTDL